MQTYESGDKSWRVPAAQRKENPGLSTGQRRDLKCGPVKLDDSLPCPKPQFLSLPPGSNADFEGAIASEIVTWEARVTSACRHRFNWSHRDESYLGFTLGAGARSGP